MLLKRDQNVQARLSEILRQYTSLAGRHRWRMEKIVEYRALMKMAFEVEE
jgi:hypothetical protein